MGYPLTGEGNNTLDEEIVDTDRLILAIVERFRSMDRVPSVGSLGTGVSAASLGANSNDDRGSVTFTVAAGGTGAQLVLTMSTAWKEGARFAVLSPGNAAAAGAMASSQVYASADNATVSLNAGVALPNGTYVFNYAVR